MTVMRNTKMTTPNKRGSKAPRPKCNFRDYQTNKECNKPTTVRCILMTRAVDRCDKHQDDFISVVFEKVSIK